MSEEKRKRENNEEWAGGYAQCLICTCKKIVNRKDDLSLPT